jgi:hypothetical protein
MTSTTYNTYRQTGRSPKGNGCNAHLGRQVVASAKVIHQATGEVVATYEEPS